MTLHNILINTKKCWQRALWVSTFAITLKVYSVIEKLRKMSLANAITPLCRVLRVYTSCHLPSSQGTGTQYLRTLLLSPGYGLKYRPSVGLRTSWILHWTTVPAFSCNRALPLRHRPHTWQPAPTTGLSTPALNFSQPLSSDTISSSELL